MTDWRGQRKFWRDQEQGRSQPARNWTWTSPFIDQTCYHYAALSGSYSGHFRFFCGVFCFLILDLHALPISCHRLKHLLWSKFPERIKRNFFFNKQIFQEKSKWPNVLVRFFWDKSRFFLCQICFCSAKCIK